ncbi:MULTISPECIES: GAF domain-containing protein [unclassified Mucilaginibacter]|uniref:GAF domain-containing protein n=1 Tax=unclassified Mucilaginibacter TaxID=2617802 RepID=UPI0031F675DA
MSSKNFDSEFCGSLPLHHVNMIQPHGYLLVLQKDSLNIVQVSENISDVLNIEPSEVINTCFDRYIPREQFEDLKNKLQSGIQNKIPITISLSDKSLLLLVHTHQDYLLLEVEKNEPNAQRSFINVFEEIKYVMGAIDVATTVQHACDIAIHELKRISGFDGIMMYRFDKNWNGTVIAEEKEDGLEQYLGVTFPASDVPKQARNLYLKNPYRLIPNREYIPIKLYPVLNPITNSFTDLSDCNLRSVAAVHLEYLANMGVTASMSVRVIHNEQLWGLIACHHKTPYYLNFEICSIFELLSSVISNKISAIINKEEYDFVAHLQAKRNRLIEQLYADNDIATGLLNNDNNVMKLFNATGAVVYLNGEITTAGNVPEGEVLENLQLWLQAKNTNQVFATIQLADIFDEALAFTDIASGMLAIPIDMEAGDYIICFRPEVVRTIEWGGNPNQAVNFEPNGLNYHPRNSFKSWLETVDKTSLPWHEQELSIAETFRSFVFEYKIKQTQ